MAYTRIHAITRTLNKALDYIENPEKTEEQLLVSGYNVDPLSASVEFEMTAALAREVKGDYSRTGGANNLAYHMIQSFSPYDKISPEQAHEMGRRWADEILQGQHEYVISTHVDKGHIHNHIIFNSVSFYDYKKFETVPYKTAAQLRKISDRLCEEQGLYVIRNPNLKQKSPTHYEWEQKKQGTSWKAQVKDSIDKAILKCSDYDSFRAELEKQGIEILEGARITFHKIGVVSANGRAAKCRGDRLGDDYTKERILARLAEPKGKQHEKDALPNSQRRDKPELSADAPKEKAQLFSSYDKKVEWEARKTKLAATKELAAALLTIRAENIQQESDFGTRIDALSDKASEVCSTMKDLAGRNKQYKDAAKYLLAFNQCLPIKQEFEKQLPFKKKKFASLHEGELRMFDHAAAQLEKLGVNTNVDPDKVIALVEEQDGKISSLSENLKEVTARIDKIRKAQQVVQMVTQEKQPEQEKKKERGEVVL